MTRESSYVYESVRTTKNESDKRIQTFEEQYHKKETTKQSIPEDRASNKTTNSKNRHDNYPPSIRSTSSADYGRSRSRSRSTRHHDDDRETPKYKLISEEYHRKRHLEVITYEIADKHKSDHGRHRYLYDRGRYDDRLIRRAGHTDEGRDDRPEERMRRIKDVDVLFKKTAYEPKR